MVLFPGTTAAYSQYTSAHVINEWVTGFIPQFFDKDTIHHQSTTNPRQWR
jgi:hypothetical protein